MALSPSAYAVGTIATIPARTGVAMPLYKGQAIKIINTHGTQVVDTWAVSTDLKTYMSMCQSRTINRHLSPVPGDTLFDNFCQPMLQFVEDTTPSGVHDALVSACNLTRYHRLGVPEDQYHENCSDNFSLGLKNDCGIDTGKGTDKSLPPAPDPLNFFMNVPIHPKKAEKDMMNADDVCNVTAGAPLTFEGPVCRPGDFVKLKALRDCIVVMSACPQDILKINNRQPTEAHFLVEDQ